jgi:hypothetical protein
MNSNSGMVCPTEQCQASLNSMMSNENEQTWYENYDLFMNSNSGMVCSTEQCQASLNSMMSNENENDSTWWENWSRVC